MLLAGNEHIKSLIQAMIQKEREPHSLIITGEHGQGRKTAARYIAAAMLCESKTGVPCCGCRTCRMIADGIHPDVMTLKANDNGNYPVEDIREVVADAITAPNEGRLKVYIIPDFDKSKITGEQVQNILLKLIEEPPDHVVMILTADSREAFLPTILSRTVCMSVTPCTNEETIAYIGLLDKYEYGEIGNAVDALGGNIGVCIEYLEHGSIYSAIESARGIAVALLSRNEYGILKILTDCDSKKGLLRETLVQLSLIAHDSAVSQIGGEMIGCDRTDAKLIGMNLGKHRCERLYALLGDYISRIDRNCSRNLVINSLTARMATI